MWLLSVFATPCDCHVSVFVHFGFFDLSHNKLLWGCLHRGHLSNAHFGSQETLFLKQFAHNSWALTRTRRSAMDMFWNLLHLLSGCWPWQRGHLARANGSMLFARVSVAAGISVKEKKKYVENVLGSIWKNIHLWWTEVNSHWSFHQNDKKLIISLIHMKYQMI